MAINILIIAKSYEEAVRYYEEIFDVECDAKEGGYASSRDILYLDYKHGIAIRYLREYAETCGLRADKIFATKEVMESEWYKHVVRKFMTMREIPIDSYVNRNKD